MARSFLSIARSIARSIAWAVLASSLGAATVAKAEIGPEAAAAKSSTVVVFAVQGDRAVDADAYHDAIEEHANSVGLDVERQPASAAQPLARALEASEAPGCLGVFWIERHTSGLAIYLYEPREQGVFIREIAITPEESDASLVESVGLIVASIAAALQEGRDVGMRPIAPAELLRLFPDAQPEPEPTPPPPTGDPTGNTRRQPEQIEPEPGRLRVFASYLGDGFNRTAPWQSGFRIGAGVLLHPRIRIGLGYGLLLPTTVGRGPTLRVTRHEIGVEVGIGGDLGDRISLHGTALLTANLTRWRTSDDAGLRPIARMGPLLELGIRVVDGLYVDIGAGALVSLNAFDFVVCDSPETRCTDERRNVVATGWRLSPRATLGLSYRPQRRIRATAKKSHPIERDPTSVP